MGTEEGGFAEERRALGSYEYILSEGGLRGRHSSMTTLTGIIECTSGVREERLVERLGAACSTYR